MSTNDVIKKSVIEMLGAGYTLHSETILLRLLAAALFGLYIFMIYKNMSKSAFYSKDLNITIAGIPIVVAAIMIAMQSNLIVSLGMVGALSIVRFRTAVKNPLDLLYLFWAISVGIISGVGLEVLGIILCIVLTALILVLQIVPASRATSVLVIRTSESEVDWPLVYETLKKYGKGIKEKSKTFKSGYTEVIYELYTKQEEELFVELRKNSKLNEISILSHDGEYRI